MKVGILRNIAAMKSWTNPEDKEDIFFMEQEERKNAFDKEYDSDAHFVCYTCEQHPIPRLKKVILPKLTEIGLTIKSHMIAIDYDNPDHKPWTQELWDKFQSDIEKASERGFFFPIDYSVFYTTTHGARWVYFLSYPVTPARAERLHAGIVREFSVHGISVDPTVWDWTRAFRLPMVQRKGKPTKEDKFFVLDIDLDNKLALSDLTEADPGKNRLKNEYADIRSIDSPIPDSNVVHSYLYKQNRSGKLIDSEWTKTCKKYLKNRESGDFLYDINCTIPVGERNTTLYNLVSQAIGLLYHRTGSSPESVYSIFLEPVQQMASLTGEVWEETLWSMVCRVWSLEDAQQRARSEAREAEELTLRESIEKGISEWCTEPEFLNTETRDAWIAGHLIVSTTNKIFYIMTREGHYDKMGVAPHNLVPRIMSLGMEQAIEVTKLKNGEWIDRSERELINQYATVCPTVEAVVGAKESYIDVPDTPYAKLVYCPFTRRTDLIPEFITKVDEWLNEFAGSYKKELEEWIGQALAFDEGPICALSLVGEQGAGKKMFVQGLAECITTGEVSDVKEFSRFQSGLFRSPFLVVDEGFPRNTGGNLDPADSFRAMVGGTPTRVEEKHKNPVVVRNPLRIIFTANNLEVINSLTAHRDLTPEDRDALAIRIKHISLGRTASSWLRMRGGLKYTEGWVKGDSTGEGDYLLARHFLYLYEARKRVPAGNRLLVEGDLDSPIVEQMAIDSGASPEILETIVHMVSHPQTLQTGVYIQKGIIYVTPEGILDSYRRVFEKHSRKSINIKVVNSVLEALKLKGQQKVQKRVNGKRAYWTKLDPDILHTYCLKHGIVNDKLDQIILDGKKTLTLKEDELELMRRRKGLLS